MVKFFVPILSIYFVVQYTRGNPIGFGQRARRSLSYIAHAVGNALDSDGNDAFSWIDSSDSFQMPTGIKINLPFGDKNDDDVQQENSQPVIGQKSAQEANPGDFEHRSHHDTDGAFAHLNDVFDGPTTTEYATTALWTTTTIATTFTTPGEDMPTDAPELQAMVRADQQKADDDEHFHEEMGRNAMKNWFNNLNSVENDGSPTTTELVTTELITTGLVSTTSYPNQDGFEYVGADALDYSAGSTIATVPYDSMRAVGIQTEAPDYFDDDVNESAETMPAMVPEEFPTMQPEQGGFRDAQQIEEIKKDPPVNITIPAMRSPKKTKTEYLAELNAKLEGLTGEDLAVQQAKNNLKFKAWEEKFDERQEDKQERYDAKVSAINDKNDRMNENYNKYLERQEKFNERQEKYEERVANQAQKQEDREERQELKEARQFQNRFIGGDINGQLKRKHRSTCQNIDSEDDQQLTFLSTLRDHVQFKSDAERCYTGRVGENCNFEWSVGNACGTNNAVFRVKNDGKHKIDHRAWHPFKGFTCVNDEEDTEADPFWIPDSDEFTEAETKERLEYEFDCGHCPWPSEAEWMTDIVQLKAQGDNTFFERRIGKDRGMDWDCFDINDNRVFDKVPLDGYCIPKCATTQVQQATNTQLAVKIYCVAHQLDSNAKPASKNKLEWVNGKKSIWRNLGTLWKKTTQNQFIKMTAMKSKWTELKEEVEEDYQDGWICYKNIQPTYGESWDDVEAKENNGWTECNARGWQWRERSCEGTCDDAFQYRSC